MAKASYGKIWMIDFFLRNLVDYQIVSTNPDSQPDLMLDIVENEVYVVYAVQASITTKCPMDFSSYPFDSQTCRLEILSNDIKVTFEPSFHSEIRLVLEFELQLQSLHENITVEMVTQNGLTYPSKSTLHLKFIYFEKATKFDEIFILVLLLQLQ